MLPKFFCEVLGHKPETAHYPGQFAYRCARCLKPIWKKEVQGEK